MERVFGNYTLIERIGVGGMGEVFRAVKRGPDGFEKIVAIKLILPHLSREETFRSMFSREARLAARLKHPNIVDVQGFDILEGTAYIEMEYVPGSDLRHILRSFEPGQRLPLDESIHILYSTARGLHHAHTSGSGNVVHRDLNPHNILISTQGEVKIADFGIAKAFAAEGAESATLRGKLSYMSPEQLQGKNLDRRSDLFSLGIITYQLITGEHPFERGSEAAVISAIQAGEPRALSGQDVDIPEELQRIWEQLLKSDPEERPDDLTEICHQLEKILRPQAAGTLGKRASDLSSDAGHSSPPDVTRGTIPRPQPLKHIPAILALMGAILILVILFKPLPFDNTSRRTVQQSGAANSLEGTRESPVRQEDLSRKPASKLVTIKTVPAGAEVSINGLLRGKTPFQVSTGPDGHLSGIAINKYGFQSEIVKILPDTGETLKIDLVPLPTSSVQISAIPWAEIYYRGNNMGTTPMVLKDIPLGKRSITLRNDPLKIRRTIVIDVVSKGNTIQENLNTPKNRN